MSTETFRKIYEMVRQGLFATVEEAIAKAEQLEGEELAAFFSDRNVDLANVYDTVSHGL